MTELMDRMADADGPISVDDMVTRGKLLSLDATREILASTEPLRSIPFYPGSGISFRAEKDWQDGVELLHGTAPVGVYLRVIGAEEYQLSKDAVLSSVKPFGMSGSYALRCPSDLLATNLNYWYQDGLNPDKQLQLLVVGEAEIGQAVTRETLRSFSNLEILDRVVQTLSRQYPIDSLYADVAKLAHSLRRTFLQIVIPAESHTVQGEGATRDDWWVGLQFRNSLVAEIPTVVSGYFYRPICTNGMVDVGPTLGTWSRRSGSDPEEVYAWAGRAVDEVLGGFEHTLDQVRSATQHSLEGELVDVTRDVFEQFSIPQRAQHRVIEALVEDGDLTAYSVINAITRAANDADRPEEAQLLMATGGELARQHERCDNCRRLMI